MSYATQLLELEMRRLMPSNDPPAVPQCCPGGRARHLSPERQERHDRWTAWQAAARRTEYAKALLDAKRAEILYLHSTAPAMGDNVTLISPSGPSEEELLRLLKQAKAVQLLVPANDRQALKWKRREAERFAAYLPIDKDELARVMAEDEAWLVAHAPPRRGGRKAKPELQLVA